MLEGTRDGGEAPIHQVRVVQLQHSEARAGVGLCYVFGMSIPYTYTPNLHITTHLERPREGLHGPLVPPALLEERQQRLPLRRVRADRQGLAPDQIVARQLEAPELGEAARAQRGGEGAEAWLLSVVMMVWCERLRDAGGV